MKTDTIKEEKINFLLCNKENENNLNKNNPNERQYNQLSKWYFIKLNNKKI